MIKVIVVAVCVGLLPTASVAQQPAPCNQIDQAQQIQCQMRNAITTRNYSLMQKIFDSHSPYIDVNDFWSSAESDPAATDVLFKNGLNPNLRVGNPGRHVLINIIENNLGLNPPEQIAPKTFELYVKHGASLTLAAIDGQRWDHVYHFLFSKCVLSPAQYPRINAMLKIALDLIPDNVRDALVYPNFYNQNFVHSFAQIAPVGFDLQNCMNQFDLLSGAMPPTLFPQLGDADAQDSYGLVPADYAVFKPASSGETICSWSPQRPLTTYNFLMSRHMSPPRLSKGQSSKCYWHP